MPLFHPFDGVTEETFQQVLDGALHHLGKDREYCVIPPHIVRAIGRYACLRQMPGAFVRAVLENDLVNAIGRADFYSQRSLPSIVRLVYNEIPGPAWKSVEAVKAWVGEEAYNRALHL